MAISRAAQVLFVLVLDTSIEAWEGASLSFLYSICRCINPMQESLLIFPRHWPSGHRKG